MARGARARDYAVDDDMYDMERDSYRHRRRRNHDSDRYYEKDHGYARRHSIPPPLERMQRLRVRDLARPEYSRDDADDELAGQSEADGIDVPLEEALSEFESPRDYDRRRHRRRPPRVMVPEEDLVPPQDSDGGLTDHEADRDVYPHRDDYDRLIPRRKRERRPKPELEDVYSGGDELTPDGHRRARSDLRYPPIPRRRPMPGYHADLEDDDGRGAGPSPSRRALGRERVGFGPEDYRDIDSIHTPEPIFRRSRRPPERDKASFELGDRQGLSSPESEDSAEVSDDPVSPTSRSRASQHLRVPEAFPASRRPRAPSPEVSFEGPRLQLRKERESRKREVLDKPRDATDIPSLASGPSPEASNRRMKERIYVPGSRAGSPEPELEKIARELQHDDQRTPREQEILEDIPVKGAADHWAIVNSAPKSRASTRDSSTSQEVPHSRARERKTKFTTSDERHSDNDTDYGRARIARRYVGLKEKRDRLWTEITKDLVVKEAIERAGYEYEETVTSYFIFSYLQYEDVSALVELSEDIRLARRRRIQELDRRRASVSSPMALEDEASPSSRRRHRDGRKLKDREIREDSRGRRRAERW